MGVIPSGVDIFKVCDFVCSHFGFERGDTFYYISIPHMSDPVYFPHMQYLKSIETDGMKVLKRKLQYKSTNEKKITVRELVDDMNISDKDKAIVLSSLLTWIGNVEKKEKGIDVMLAVDLIKYTIEGTYARCIVFTGDVDLLSAMKYAESKGGNILSSSFRSGYSSELRQGFPNKHFVMELDDILNNCLKDKTI